VKGTGKACQPVPGGTTRGQRRPGSAARDVPGATPRGPTDLNWDLDTYAARAAAFGARVFVIDGHDLAAIDQALAEAGDLSGHQPSVIVARTRKGRGFSEVEDREGWHGRPLPEPMAERAVVELGGERNLLVRGPRPAEAAKPRAAANGAEVKLPGYERGLKVATRRAYGDALAALGARPDVVAMDGEVSNSTFADEFAKAYPERYFEMFIAEQQLIAAAVGIGARGYRPFASTFAAFFTRAYDFIRMAAISRLHRAVPERRDQRRRPRPGHGRPGGHLLPADHPGRLPGAVRLRGDLPGRRVQGAAPDR
jgi:transketolase